MAKHDDQVDALFYQQEASGAATGLLHKERRARRPLNGPSLDRCSLFPWR